MSRLAIAKSLVRPTQQREHVIRPESGSTNAPSKLSTSEQGLTLIECLVAIVMIAITGAMIAPPLLLATATRLQNQRAEQSLQLAQAEVDRIQTLVNRRVHASSALPAVSTTATSTGNLDDQGAPNGSSGILRSVNSSCANDNYTGQQIAVDKLLEIDVDGDCDLDFLMQVFRTRGEYNATEQLRSASDRRPSTFGLMVRVYSASASTNLSGLGTDPASLQFTSGQGNQRERPLAVLSTNVNWSDTDDSLLCYHDTNSSDATDCTPNPPSTPPSTP